MGEGRTILEEEIEQLRCLRKLMESEKDCLVGMNGEGLLRVVREKDGLVRRLRRLKEKRQGLGREADASGGHTHAVRELLGVRNALVSEIRERSRVHERILENQSEQVGRLLGFFQSVFSRGSVYNRNGRMRSP